MSNNWTEEALADFYGRRGDVVAAPGVKRAGAPKVARPEPVSGPLSVTLVLHGHCPSKKSNYRVSASGGLVSTDATKRQIEALTLQAMFQWGSKFSGPVEHPEVTTRFYVATARQDEDGMYVTLMDMLQKARVIVNDNIAHFNGRKVHEPCEFVKPEDERVEILIRKEK